MEAIKKSWSSFSQSASKNYLRGFGGGSIESAYIVADVIKSMDIESPKVLELGCGNAQLLNILLKRGCNILYTGLDFSEPLLDIAKQEHADDKNVDFLLGDAEKLENINERYDVVLYSHVIEMLSSPEESLMNASKIADNIIIRFFEPPIHEFDTVELKEMNVSEDGHKMPYLRRKMSKNYYEMILCKIGCKHVDVYDDLTSNDEVHLLRLK